MRVNTASLSLRTAAAVFRYGWDLPAITTHQVHGWMHADRAGRQWHMSGSSGNGCPPGAFMKGAGPLDRGQRFFFHVPRER